jgi:hypothetical protein
MEVLPRALAAARSSQVADSIAGVVRPFRSKLNPMDHGPEMLEALADRRESAARRSMPVLLSMPMGRRNDGGKCAALLRPRMVEICETLPMRRGVERSGRHVTLPRTQPDFAYLASETSRASASSAWWPGRDGPRRRPFGSPAKPERYYLDPRTPARVDGYGLGGDRVEPGTIGMTSPPWPW